MRTSLATARDHPRHLVLFALVAGLLCGGWAPPAAPVAAAACVPLAATPPVAALTAGAVAAGALVAGARRKAIDRGVMPAAPGRFVRLRAVLLERFRSRASGRRVAAARVLGGAAHGERMLVSATSGSAPPGTILELAGRVRRLGRWDEFQRRRGAAAAIEASWVRDTRARRGGAAGLLDVVRTRAEAGLSRGLPAREAALLRGMVLGQDEAIPDAVRDDWEVSGLAHLLAVSGTNVMLLAALVLGAGAATGLDVRLRLLAALALIALYVPLTGGSASIQRAGVMGAAGLVALLAGRPASRWYGLGLAAAATLALNPYAAGEPGWQLSFAAVVGLLVMAPRLREHLRTHRVPPVLAEAGAMTVAATVATAPLLAAHFEQVSLVSLPANLAAAVVVGPVMWTGMAAAALAQVEPVLAAPLTVVAGVLTAFLAWLAHVFAALPAAAVSVSLPGPVAVTGAYAAMACAPWAVGRLRDRWMPRARACWGEGGGTRRAAAAAGVAFLLLVLAAAAGGGQPPRLAAGETMISFLDVGQGDATLVQRDGMSLLVDTGPPDGPVVERVREAGVERLDALLITHAQSDHEGAAISVVERFRPRLVLNGGRGWPSAVQRMLAATVRAAGGRSMTPVAGDSVRVGRLRLDVMWPPRALAESPPEGDPNERAVVAHLRSGELDLLLPADAESGVTAALRLPRVELLKVAHHGSADEGLPALLERLRPDLAAIEVGRGNPYGHPAPSTLDALRDVPQVYRTDRDGTVRVRAADGVLRVERRGGWR